jgi:hypothetical protein
MNNERHWVAQLPVALTAAEKRCLSTIARFGSYLSGSSTGFEPDVLAALEEREFLLCRRDRAGGPLISAVTETGKMWLKRCSEPTLSDDLTALFNSLDEPVQRRAAMQIGMELHPERSRNSRSTPLSCNRNQGIPLNCFRASISARRPPMAPAGHRSGEAVAAPRRRCVATGRPACS